MFLRSLAFSAVAALALAASAEAQLPCASAVGDCVLSSTATVPVGVYDIRPRNLVVQNKTITISGAGLFEVLANNITFQPGGRFISTGTDGNTQVSLDAAGTLELQSMGTSKSRIDVSGNFGGGAIMLRSAGNLTVNGTLIANATNLLGYGGPIDLVSQTGNITVTGDPSEGIKSFGNAQGGGGVISLMAPVGSISISTQIVPKGGDCANCEISLDAGGDITSTAQGVMDLRASGIGDGGFFSVNAGGNVNLAGNILANGSSDELEGGTGGDVLISAAGSVTIGGRVELNGAGQDAAPGSELGSVDGDGGSADISASGNIVMNGPMFGISKGLGQSDEFSFDALGNVTLAAEIDMTGDNYGGDVTVLSEGLVTVSARVRTQTPIDPVNKPGALGGTIDISGCQINVAPLGEVIATGPGGNPSGANFFAASTGLTVAGTVTATSINELVWRTSIPVVTGTVTPAAMLVQNAALPCCGVTCPTTTTSTSTTSTTSTSTTTSSTTSTSLPGATTSTTTTIPTTSSTSTTSTVKPTTSSTSTTVAPTTTTSSTSTSTSSSSTSTSPSTSAPSSTSIPGTTSTTTTVAPTTTTSTTVPGTTSTTGASTSTSTTVTSSTAPTTSTSTTSVVTSSSSTTDTLPASTTTLPLTCFDTALGIEAVRCRLDAMAETIGQASEDALGGRKLARRLSVRVAKAAKLSVEPLKTIRLRKASKQLKAFGRQIAKGVAAGKVDAALGETLSGFAAEASAELDGLATVG